MSLVIAIDGPSGSGKSTLARAVAQRLRLAYLDTGAMYRAAALWVACNGALDNPAGMPGLVETMDLAVGLDPAAPTLHLAGQDIGQAIRAPETSTMVSRVSTVIPVRHVMLRRQRAIIARERTPEGWAQGRGVVAEGRDITTVVAPDAEARLLLTAAPAVRLARRTAELQQTGAAPTAAAMQDQVLRRDRDDATVAEFTAPAPGVVLVDSTTMDAAQTLDYVLALVSR